MNGIKYGCRLIALLILLTLLTHWQIIFRPLKIIYYLQAADGFAIMLVVTGFLFLIVNLFAAAGIYRKKWWGFVLTYLAIVYSTVIFSVSYIPLFTRLFPGEYSSLALLMANVSVIFFVIYLQVVNRVKPPRARAARAPKVVEVKAKPKRKSRK